MKLALGTAQFGMRYGISNVRGKVSQEDGKAIIQYAASVGIDTIDTAIAYGDSEQILGDIGVKDFKVVTKLPEIPDHINNVEDWVTKSIRDSIFYLGVDSLYALLLHRPSQLFESKGVKILTAIKSLKESGLVKNLGVSVYAPFELETLFDTYKFDIVQCPLNLVDRRLISSGWLKKLNTAGVEIHIRSCFLQGLLLLPRESIPSKFEAWNVLWDNWHTWMNSNKASPIEACISYVLSFPEITKVIVGVETKHQLEEIIGAVNSTQINNYPNISSNVTDLINPANWDNL